MSTQEIKQNLIDAFFKLLNTPWSIVAVFLGMIWLWIKLSPDEVNRIMELEPILNSKVGISLSVLVIISYIVSLIGKVKDDVREIFTNPVKEMIYILAGMKEDMKNIEEKFEKSIDKGEQQRIEIKEILESQRKFFDGG